MDSEYSNGNTERTDEGISPEDGKKLNKLR